jgi:DNA-binding response OmpR family regulator
LIYYNKGCWKEIGVFIQELEGNLSKRILLVDDDALLRRSLAFNLEQIGFQVRTASSAEEALEAVHQNQPDLVILDIGLPGMDGMEALKQLREKYHLPVIFLTARRRELDEVLGLELGADDYITKPFNLDVLVAHIKSVLRRVGQPQTTSTGPEPVVAGDLMIDPGSHTATLGGKTIDLSPREFDLLLCLASEAGRVITVEDLISRVWGAEFAGESQVVYVHIRWLREKVEEDPNHPRRLLTVRGVGYKLIPVEGHA